MKSNNTNTRKLIKEIRQGTTFTGYFDGSFCTFFKGYYNLFLIDNNRIDFWTLNEIGDKIVTDYKEVDIEVIVTPK